MNKADFVTGIPVRLAGSSQIMTLGGTPERWVCTWEQGGQQFSRQFDPAQLERAADKKDGK